MDIFAVILSLPSSAPNDKPDGARMAGLILFMIPPKQAKMIVGDPGVVI
jgi:hypothetical protein